MLNLCIAVAYRPVQELVEEEKKAVSLLHFLSWQILNLELLNCAVTKELFSSGWCDYIAQDFLFDP